MKIYKSQTGFAPLLLIGLLLFVGAAGFGGYKVYQAKKAKTATTNQTTTQNTQQDTKKDENKIPEGFVEYKNEELGFKFAYPKIWDSLTCDEAKKKINWYCSDGWVVFASSDYKKPAGEGPGPTAEAGYLLEIGVLEDTEEYTIEEAEKNAKEAQEAHGGRYEIVRIDGKEAIITNTHTHGTYVSASVTKNKTEYIFRLNVVNDSKKENWDLLKQILSTVEIK